MYSLLEQFFDRLSHVARGRRDVFESAAKRIVVADGCVVNSERRINRGRDVFGINGTLCRPSGILHVGASRRGFAQHAPAAYSTTRDQGGMDEIMISSLAVRDVSDGSSEFTLNDNQGFIESCSGCTAWHRCQISHKVTESDIELARRAVNPRIRSIDVLVIVP